MIANILSLDLTGWVLVFLISIFLMLIGNMIFKSPAEVIHKRIEEMEVFTSGTTQEIIMKESLSKRLMRMAEEKVSTYVEKNVKRGKFASLKTKLMQARMDIDPIHHTSQKFIYAVIFSAVSLFLGNMMWTIGAFALGFFIPDLRLNEALKKRQYRLKAEIPDFLDLLAATAPSAKNLEDAILKVVERTEGEISDEFKQVLEEVNAGRQTSDALKDMSLRCGVQEIDTLISQINQSEAFGTGVEKTLQTQSERLRVLKKQLAEIKARKSAVTLMLPSLFLLVTCLVMIAGPAIVPVLSGGTGF